MKQKILLVEDDPSVVRITSYALEQAGYQVLISTDGLEGLGKAQTEDVDLIILDIMLPGLDGFELCGSLRGDSRTADVPVLMVTAKAQPADRDIGLEMGANAYI